MANKSRGLRRLVKATGYSMAGLRATFVNEEAFRTELGLAIILAPVAIWQAETRLELALLLTTLMLVLLMEVINSAIEAVVDRFGEEHHVLAGRAKDMGSAVVFLSLVLFVLVWVLLLWP